ACSHSGRNSAVARSTRGRPVAGKSFSAKTGERGRRRTKKDRSQGGGYFVSLRLPGQRPRIGKRNRTRVRVVRGRNDFADGFAAANCRPCPRREDRQSDRSDAGRTNAR